MRVRATEEAVMNEVQTDGTGNVSDNDFLRRRGLRHRVEGRPVPLASAYGSERPQRGLQLLRRGALHPPAAYCHRHIRRGNTGRAH